LLLGNRVLPALSTELTCGYSCSPGGIGHALALELKHRGLKVFATGRTLQKISDLGEAGIECVALSVDDPKSVASCHEEMVKLLDGNGLDFLFNNAGIGT
jgi:1-acylglycerone phosphate reductase